jgi:multiple sugar transport system substrate-binding protein
VNQPPAPSGPSAPSALSRRTLLRGSLFGAAAFGVPVAALSACGGNPKTSTAAGQVTFGSNYSDAVPRKALAATINAFQQSSKNTVKINTVDHVTFQENINRYLRGTPDDVFCWFAGERMQFFAAQNLATDISDVWQDIGGGYSPAFKQASTGEDGKQYFVPFTTYPWAIFYRKSVWQEKGYEVPKTLDELTALCKRMQADGLIPLGFADKEGFPAMGTFDHINMRVNGFDYHMRLMHGQEAWTTPQAKAIFDTWRGLMPYHQPGANGRLWEEAAQDLVKKKSGMFLLGMFVAQQFPAGDVGDLDFFNFPEIDPQHGTDSIEAPIDGFMISAKVKNEARAKQMLRFLGSPQGQAAYLTVDKSMLAASVKSDTSGYTALQKKGAEYVESAKNIAQFLDRDTRPDFASTVMIPALQRFINRPDDIDSLLKDIEAQRKNIFTS